MSIQFLLETVIGAPIGVYRVGMCSQLFIVFPKSLGVPENLVLFTLGLEEAQPIHHVSCTSVGKKPDEATRKKYSDKDKPIENGLAYRTEYSSTKWASYWSPERLESGGRFYVECSNNVLHSNYEQFTFHGYDKEVIFERNNSTFYYSYRYKHSNKYAVDSPGNDLKSADFYMPRFVELGLKIASTYGCGITAINACIPSYVSSTRYKIPDISFHNVRLGYLDRERVQLVHLEFKDYPKLADLMALNYPEF